MATIYTKQVGDYTINIADNVTVDKEETYTNSDRTAYTIEAWGVYMVTFQTTLSYTLTNPYIHRDGGNTINPNGFWARALYFDNDASDGLVLRIAGNDAYNGLVTSDLYNYFPVLNWSIGAGGSSKQCTFCTNLPIFDTEAEALDYVSHENVAYRKAYIEEHAINFVKEEYEETTKNYFISNQRGQANCVRNSATATGDLSWRSIRFMANSEPVLYFNDDYSLTLSAPGLVASYSLPSPVYIIDNVPESSWHDYLDYTGLWYGNIATRLKAKGETIPDGSYMYGFDLSTNIYIFKDKATADDAMENDDYSEAVNYTEVSGGGSYNPPEFGDDEQTTTFGEGADTSPFMQTYILSRNALIQVAQAWYNTNPSTIADILTGLKMFGDIPQECLAGVTMYPFDASLLLNTASQQYIYFGTYQLSLGTTINKAVSLKSNAYLDCGTIFLQSLFHSYKDYHCTTLDVYLPYIGWQRVDLSLVINKNVNVRYYVDIHTRACVAVILANGVFIAQYAGNIGVGLPTCGADYQGYANAMASTILGGASNVYTGAKGMQGAAMGSIGNAVSGAGLGMSIMGGVGGVALGAASVAANTAATLNKLDTLGAPADHPQIKGGFTSCLGTYLPQYVLWRYIIHDTVEPTSFNELCGRPSSASGNVGSFSGFLSCKSVNLNTSNMLDAEASEVYSLLKNGIFV